MTQADYHNLPKEEQIKISQKILAEFEADLDQIRTCLRSTNPIRENFKCAEPIIESIFEYQQRTFRPNLMNIIDLAREITAEYLKLKLPIQQKFKRLMKDFAQPDLEWDQAWERIKNGEEIPGRNSFMIESKYGMKLIELGSEHITWGKEQEAVKLLSEVDPIYWRFMHFAYSTVVYYYY